MDTPGWNEGDPGARDQPDDQLPAAATTTRPTSELQDSIDYHESAFEDLLLDQTLCPEASSTPSLYHHNRSRAINPLLDETFLIPDLFGDLAAKSQMPSLSLEDTSTYSEIPDETVQISPEFSNVVSNPGYISESNSPTSGNNATYSIQEPSDGSSSRLEGFVNISENTDILHHNRVQTPNTSMAGSGVHLPPVNFHPDLFVVDTTQLVHISDSILNDVSEFSLEETLPSAPATVSKEGARGGTVVREEVKLSAQELELASSREAKSDNSITLLEDISDSILDDTTSSQVGVSKDEIHLDNISNHGEIKCVVKYGFNSDEEFQLISSLRDDSEDNTLTQCNTCHNTSCTCNNVQQLKRLTINKESLGTIQCSNKDTSHITFIEDISDSLLNNTSRITELDYSQSDREKVCSVTHSDSEMERGWSPVQERGVAGCYGDINQTGDPNMTNGRRSDESILSSECSSFHETDGSNHSHQQEKLVHNQFNGHDGDLGPWFCSDVKGGQRPIFSRSGKMKTVSPRKPKPYQPIYAAPKREYNRHVSRTDQGTTTPAATACNLIDHPASSVDHNHTLATVDRGIFQVGGNFSQTTIQQEGNVDPETDHSFNFVDQRTNQPACTTGQESVQPVAALYQSSNNNNNNPEKVSSIYVNQETLHPINTESLGTDQQVGTSALKIGQFHANNQGTSQPISFGVGGHEAERYNDGAEQPTCAVDQGTDNSICYTSREYDSIAPNIADNIETDLCIAATVEDKNPLTTSQIDIAILSHDTDKAAVEQGIDHIISYNVEAELITTTNTLKSDQSATTVTRQETLQLVTSTQTDQITTAYPETIQPTTKYSPDIDKLTAAMLTADQSTVDCMNYPGQNSAAIGQGNNDPNSAAVSHVVPEAFRATPDVKMVNAEETDTDNSIEVNVPKATMAHTHDPEEGSEDGGQVSQNTSDPHTASESIVAQTPPSEAEVNNIVGSHPPALDVSLDLEAYDASCPRELNTSSTEPKVLHTQVLDNCEEVTSFLDEEVYQGLGESDTSLLSVASRRSALTPAELKAAEEDMVDGLFYSCDTEGLGRVPAALLASHLALSLGDLQPRWLMDTLREAVCSEGDDNELDLATFREILTGWLHDHATYLNLPLPHNTSGTQPQQMDASLPLEPREDNLDTNGGVTPIRSQGLGHTPSHTATPSGYSAQTPDSYGRFDDTGTPEDSIDPTPPRRKFGSNIKRCLERHFATSNRRSTLLPRASETGGVGRDEGGRRPDAAPSDTTLVMSRLPSPIAHPTSFIYNHNPHNNNNNNANALNNDSFTTNNEKMSCRDPLVDQSGLNYTVGSIEDEGGITKPDPGELQQAVLELTHTNRRLTGEKADLTAILTNTEDAYVSSQEHAVSLEQDLAIANQQLVAARRLEVEMGEVRIQLESEREEREKLQRTLAQLEKDNVALSSRVEALVTELNSTREEAENQAMVEAELVRNHRAEVAALVTELDKWKYEAERQALASHHLEETVKDIRKHTEALRDEKASLEEQLTHLKEEIASARNHSDSNTSCVDMGGEEDLSVSTSEEVFERPLKTAWRRAPSSSTPLVNQGAPSSVPDTPLSIHYEIQTMGERSGSLPFCEKSGNSATSASKSPTEETSPLAGQHVRNSSLATLLISMVRWWRDWEERGVPLLKGMVGEDASALNAHFSSHHNELIRLERELKEIRRQSVTHSLSSSGTPARERVEEGSLGMSRETCLPPSQNVTPKSKRSRTPGSLISQLITKFEHSSRSTSPASSELSERLGLMYNTGTLSKMVERQRAGRGSLSSYNEYDCGRSSPSYDGGSSVSSDAGKMSSLSPRNSSLTSETMKEGKDNSLEIDSCINHKPSQVEAREDTSDKNYFSKNLSGAQNLACELSPNSWEYGGNLINSSTEQDSEYTYVDDRDLTDLRNIVIDNLEQENVVEEVDEVGVKLDLGFDEDLTDDYQSERSSNLNSNSSKLADDTENNGVTVVEVDVDLEGDVLMETSQLMKLMNEVDEQKTIIGELKEQLVHREEEKESFTATLSRLHRLALQVSTDTFT
ncbi:uncharacterized protein [Procambarus clarkii]|uniref:uncharacterized protein n=1 Tax=Procambarus clarkii TaxID=6728 RepID=UPI00374223B5